MMIQTPVRRHMDLSVRLLPATLNHPLKSLSLSVHQSQYRFVCEAILKVYEEGLVKPLKTAIYQQREKVDEEREEDKKEQQKAGEGEETATMEEGEAAVVELLEGGLDEEDDDDEEVEVLDVGEVTEEGEEEEDEEEEEVEEPSVASATSVTSETSANPDPDPANPWLLTGGQGSPGGGQAAGEENKSTVALYADKKTEKKTNEQTNVKIMDKLE